MKTKLFGLIACMAMLGVSAVKPASADLLNLGATLTINEQNSPGTNTDMIPFAAGTYSLDGGALSLTLSIVPSGADEWYVFSYTVTPFVGALSSLTLNWGLQVLGAEGTVAVTTPNDFIMFSANGVVLAPTSGIAFGGSVGTNPVPGMTGTGVFPIFPSTTVWAAATPILGTLGIDTMIAPFSTIGLDGFTPTQVSAITGFTQAIEVAPAVTPLPSTWTMLIAGFVGLGFLANRGSKKVSALRAAA
jgi:hypothetical protein